MLVLVSFTQSHCLSPVWATEEALCEKEPARSDQHKHYGAGGQYSRPAIPEKPEYQGGRKRRNEACRRYCEVLQTNSSLKGPIVMQNQSALN